MFSPGVGVAGLGWERAKNKDWLEPINKYTVKLDSKLTSLTKTKGKTYRATKEQNTI